MWKSHHNFPEPNMTFSNCFFFFFLSNSQSKNPKGQKQILTFKMLELANAWHFYLKNHFSINRLIGAALVTFLSYCLWKLAFIFLSAALCLRGFFFHINASRNALLPVPYKTKKIFWHKLKHRQPRSKLLYIYTPLCTTQNFRRLAAINIFVTEVESVRAISCNVKKTVCLCDCEHVPILYVRSIHMQKHQTVFVHISFVSFPPLMWCVTSRAKTPS